MLFLFVTYYVLGPLIVVPKEILIETPHKPKYILYVIFNIYGNFILIFLLYTIF
jgi:hypothetical protein